MKKSELSRKKEAFYPAIGLVALLWFIYILQYFGIFQACYGVIPWRIAGIKGIFLSPLFHGSLDHLISNTAPLFVLLAILFLFYHKQAYRVLLSGWLLTGVLLWMLPDFGYFKNQVVSCHIGASGLIYMLATFLFFSGIFSRQVLLILLSIFVAFLYGGLMYGIFPHLVAEGVSWQGHLLGALVGFFYAYKLNWRKKRN
ncbi:rhomboid family intramembrane serine protease [Myroides odoratus]